MRTDWHHVNCSSWECDIWISKTPRSAAKGSQWLGYSFEREMRWDGVGTWLPPGVPRSLDYQGLGSVQSVSVSPNRGCIPFLFNDSSLPYSRVDYLPCPLNYL
ncbi:hypothetical protein TNCV_2710881 [Trichonephila clavipes]|nr:hypothetical protein TNCV_2710881 [Trichonephila clavipes]